MITTHTLLTICVSLSVNVSTRIDLVDLFIYLFIDRLIILFTHSFIYLYIFCSAYHTQVCGDHGDCLRGFTGEGGGHPDWDANPSHIKTYGIKYFFMTNLIFFCLLWKNWTDCLVTVACILTYTKICCTFGFWQLAFYQPVRPTSDNNVWLIC